MVLARQKSILHVTFLSMAFIMLLFLGLTTESPEVCSWERMDSGLVRGGGDCYATRSPFQNLCNFGSKECSDYECKREGDDDDYYCHQSEAYEKNEIGWSETCATPETGKHTCPPTNIYCAVVHECKQAPGHCVKPPGQDKHYCYDYREYSGFMESDRAAEGSASCPL